ALHLVSSKQRVCSLKCIPDHRLLFPKIRSWMPTRSQLCSRSIKPLVRSVATVHTSTRSEKDATNSFDSWADSIRRFLWFKNAILRPVSVDAEYRNHHARFRPSIALDSCPGNYEPNYRKRAVTELSKFIQGCCRRIYSLVPFRRPGGKRSRKSATIDLAPNLPS